MLVVQAALLNSKVVSIGSPLVLSLPPVANRVSAGPHIGIPPALADGKFATVVQPVPL